MSLPWLRLTVAFSQPESLLTLTLLFVGRNRRHGEGRTDDVFLLFQSYTEGHVPFSGSFSQKPAFSGTLIYTLSISHLCLAPGQTPQDKEWRRRGKGQKEEAAMKNRGWEVSWHGFQFYSYLLLRETNTLFKKKSVYLLSHRPTYHNYVSTLRINFFKLLC